MQYLIKKNIWKIFFFSGIFLIFFLPAFDTDLGWHLRYGQYFFETKRFLTENNFTVFLANYVWPNSYGLCQIITFLIYKYTHYFGLSLINSLVNLLFFLLLYLFLNKNLIASSFSFFSITFFSWFVFNLGWRAQIFSIFAMVLMLYLLKKQKIIFIPLLFLIWTNFHGGFSLGLAIFSFYIFFQTVYLFKQKSVKKLVSNLLIFVFSLISTLINPYFWKIWWEAWHHLQIPMKTLIAEWVQPSILLLIVLFIFLAFSCFIFVKEKNKSDWNYFLFFGLIFFFIFSINAIRNIPFFFIFANLLIFNSRFFKKYQNNANLLSLSKALIILLFLSGFFIQLPKTLTINRNWISFCSARTMFPNPCQAVIFLKEQRIDGIFFNTFEWGGFLEWELPNSRFFVDGRMPAWPSPLNESPYTTYLKILQTQPGWNEQLFKYGINHLIIANGTFLDLELQTKKYAWEEIYRDKIAVVYKAHEKNN